MKGLMENNSNSKALRSPEVDNLSIALVYSTDLRVAEERWVLSVAHIGEDKVRAFMTSVHLSRGGITISTTIDEKEKLT